jgi:hypothetical protein
LESVRDIQCLVLSFGALDEEAPAVSAAAIGDTHESVGS